MEAKNESVKTYGCDDCKFLKGHRCTLWEVKVVNPHDSHCECAQYGATVKD